MVVWIGVAFKALSAIAVSWSFDNLAILAETVSDAVNCCIAQLWVLPA